MSERLRAMRPNKSAVLPGIAITDLKAIRDLKWLGTAIAVFTALTVVVIWLAWPQAKAQADFLLEAGYLENVPASKLYGPGTINTVEFIDNRAVHLHPTCETDTVSELLTSKIRESSTTDRQLLQLLKKRLDISEKAKEILASEAAISQTRSISLSFENAHILVITDEALLSVRKALLKDNCEEAIQWNISNGGMVCQTREVLEADVTYEMKYDDEVSVDEQARFSSEAAAKLNLVASQESANRISGRRLFYGIKLAPDAFTLNTPDAKPKRCLPP
jgi:hypothetical protein